MRGSVSRVSWSQCKTRNQAAKYTIHKRLVLMDHIRSEVATSTVSNPTQGRTKSEDAGRTLLHNFWEGKHETLQNVTDRAGIQPIGCSPSLHQRTLACNQTATCCPGLPFNGLHPCNTETNQLFLYDSSWPVIRTNIVFLIICLLSGSGPGAPRIWICLCQLI